VKFLKDKRELARKIVNAHQELTEWIKNHPDEAKKIVQAELSEEVKREVPADLVAHAWKRIILTNDVSQGAFEKWVASAQKAGFMKDAPDLGRLVEKP
jgi:NitT/TauT family transport system substrate-binding protein